MSSAESASIKSTNVRFSWAAATLAAMGGTVRAVTRVAPALGARLALELWLRPRRFAMPAREAEWVASAHTMTVGGSPAWVWGDGPTVLLVHGWEGRASQMGALGKAFADAGFRAVAIDLPAHGRASGRTLHLPAAADVIGRALDALGDVEAVVAHSFGAAATARAVAGRAIGRLVLLAPPDPSRVLGRYAAWLGLPPAVAERMTDLLSARAGLHPSALAARTLAGSLAGRGLVLHDPDDEMVPFADGAAWTAAWPGADLVRASGHGHLRLLRDPDVVARVAQFVDEPRRMRWTA